MDQREKDSLEWLIGLAILRAIIAAIAMLVFFAEVAHGQTKTSATNSCQVTATNDRVLYTAPKIAERVKDSLEIRITSVTPLRNRTVRESFRDAITATPNTDPNLYEILEAREKPDGRLWFLYTAKDNVVNPTGRVGTRGPRPHIVNPVKRDAKPR